MFALLVRTELFHPGRDHGQHEIYNQLFTLHGAVMIFLFLIPGIPAVLGNFVLPLCWGPRTWPFPGSIWPASICGGRGHVLPGHAGQRRAGYRLDLLHALQHHDHHGGLPALLGAFILGFSSIFTGLNFIVTIHTLRPPGMSWFRMPLFLWASTPRP